MRKITIAIIAACCSFAAVMTVQGRSNNRVVTAVDATAKTVTLQTGAQTKEVYHIGAFSKITIDGKKATIAEIQQGMVVSAAGVAAGFINVIDLNSSNTTPDDKKKCTIETRIIG